MSAKAIKPVSIHQQAILQAAREIIVTEGMEALTVRAIADRLELTDGALYRHFKSKEDILAMLIDETEQTLLEMVRTAGQKSGDTFEKLENILYSHLSYAEQRKGVTFILIASTYNIKATRLREKMWYVIGRYLDTIRAVLNEGVRKGVLRKDLDVEAASTIFFGLIQSMVTFWALSGYQYSIHVRRLRTMFDIYANGIKQPLTQVKNYKAMMGG
ncbi:MAG: TetR/AcrR family transcriptional regulator [Fibrobacterota bacterium]